MSVAPGLLENVTVSPIEPDLETEEDKDSIFEGLLRHLPSDQELGLLGFALILLSVITIAALILLYWRRRT